MGNYIKTKTEFLNELHLIVEGDRTHYGEYCVGDIIVSDGDEPYTGNNVFPIKGERYQLAQAPLSDFNLTRNNVYNSQGIEYKNEEDVRLDNMKRDFDNTPPIPEEDDGMHRIVVAKELGHQNILMWKKI